jgi:hypothetical protein
MDMSMQEAVFSREECTRFVMEKISVASLAHRIIKLPVVVPPLTESNVKIILEDLRYKGVIKRYSTVIRQLDKAPHRKDERNSYYILTLNKTFDGCLEGLRKSVQLIVFVSENTYKPKQKLLIIDGIKVPISESGKVTKQTRLVEVLFKSNYRLQKGVSWKMFNREVLKSVDPEVGENYRKTQKIVNAINKKIADKQDLAHVTDLITVNREGIFINNKYLFTPVDVV